MSAYVELGIAWGPHVRSTAVISIKGFVAFNPVAERGATAAETGRRRNTLLMKHFRNTVDVSKPGPRDREILLGARRTGGRGMLLRLKCRECGLQVGEGLGRLFQFLLSLARRALLQIPMAARDTRQTAGRAQLRRGEDRWAPT